MTRTRATLAIMGLVMHIGVACAGDEGSGLQPRADTDDAIATADIGEDMASEVAGADPSLRVMTFNVLCSFCGIGGRDDPWSDRLGHFADIFARHDPDIIGLQELSFDSEVAEMLELVPGFAAVHYEGPGCIVAERGWPDATILYREERFELLEHGSFWLSPTPGEPCTIGFADSGAQFPRLVVWAHLREMATGRELVVADTHFDNNPPSQELSAPLFLERLGPMAESSPLLALGDFNSKPDSTAYGILTSGVDGEGFHLADAYDLAGSHIELKNTPEPPSPYPPESRIDHVFVAGEDVSWTVSEWAVDLHVYGPEDRFPSDHRAISVELSFTTGGGDAQ